MSNKNNFRKFAVTTLAASAAVAAVAPVVSAQSVSFTDIQQGDSHYEAVIALAEQGIISGYQDGTVRPTNPISRQHVAVMLYQALELNVPTNVSEVLSVYTDVDASHPYANQIAAVTVAGAFTGNAAGEFNPSANITRQQMASSLRSGFNLDTIQADGVNVNLSNVAASHRNAVQTIANLGLTNQLNDFRPAENITRGQFATQLNGVLELLDAVPAPTPKGDVESIQAINSTTVEVKFVDGIDDIKALDFAIEGLNVTNAAVKQTDASTAVLTTAPQEGGVEYTVTANEDVLGSFTGISAVVPSGIEIASNSTQAKVGEEVTVRAQVAVEAGQSLEGIPVTFNIITHQGGVNQGAAYEVYTDANGVASYTYTQYYGGQDTVVAYPTGAPATRSTEGKVYWGVDEQLVLTEVTEGNTLANGEKKVYQVTLKNQDGGAIKNGLVNIAFEENVNVTQDNGVTGVEVTDATTGQGEYPYQYTTGGASNYNVVQVKTDENGEATFTLTGNNASVTPIVFIDGTWIATGVQPETFNGKLNATELQVAAPTLQFAAVQELEVVVESIGNRDAAAVDVLGNNSGDGGRDYKATIRDTDGKLAPRGTTVYAVVTAADLEGNVSLVDADDKVTALTANVPVKLEVGENGEVEFTLIGAYGSYATPTVFNDNGNRDNLLDPADAQGKGQIVYFGDAVLKTSVLEVKDATGEEVTSVESGQTAYFHYQVTDQNGNKNTASTNNHIATFQVKNNGFENSIFVNGIEVKARQTVSVEEQATNGNATLEVTSPNGVADVAVDVSSSQYTLTDGAATVSFTEANQLVEGKHYNGQVTKIDEDKKTVKVVIGGYEHTLSYAGAQLFEKGELRSENQFLDILERGSFVTYIKGDQDSFDITGFDALPDVPVDPVDPGDDEDETEGVTLEEVGRLSADPLNTGYAVIVELDDLQIEFPDADETSTVAIEIDEDNTESLSYNANFDSFVSPVISYTEAELLGAIITVE